MKREYQSLTIPKLEWDTETLSPLYGQLVVQPLEPGFGITFGTALRRVLLGGIEGAAVTSVIVHGINNEFSAIEGVEEDAMQLLLNIKEIRIKSKNGHAGKMRLKKNVAGVAVVSDIVADDHLELVNGEHVLAHISEGGSLDIEFFVEPGRGYQLARWPAGKALQEDDRMYLDAFFSPVTRVAYDVVKTRVGDDIDYDKLILTIETNGTQTPLDVLHYAVSVLRGQLEHFLTATEIPFNDLSRKEVEKSITQDQKEQEVSVEEEDPRMILLKSVDVLELSVRAHNCLTIAGIKRIADLVRMDEESVLKIKNFGKKSFDEVKERINSLGLTFGMNISEDELAKLAERE